MSLVDFCIVVNDWTTKNNNYLLKRLKFYSIIRFLCSRIGFFVVKRMFYFSKDNARYVLDSSSSETDIIVSLTSFPGRMNTLGFSLECILRQRLKPKRVLVYLSLKQFPDSEASLPYAIKVLEKRGIEFVFVDEDYRSHKKYFYSFQEFSNSPIITIDDDLLYDSRFVERLYKAYQKDRFKVYCSYGYLMNVNYLGELLPYNKWKLLNKACSSSKNIFFGSGGGTLFPPNFFDYRLIDIKSIKESCFHADDVWLNAFCRLKNITVEHINSYYIFDIPVREKLALSTINKGENGNDLQIANVRRLFLLKYNMDPFKVIRN